MKRIAVLFFLLALLVPASAQLTMTAVGGGFGVAAGGSFSGSGDTLSGAFAYWSCGRAYTSAYATGGGNACDIIRSSDSTTCTVKFNSTGFADVTTAYCNGSTQSVTAFCNATTCKVSKAYDQSGNTNCTTACDATQATGASQPVLNLSGLGGKVCMTFSGSQSLASAGTANSLTQPFSGSFVSERTGSTSSFSDILGVGSSGTIQFLYNNAVNQSGVFAGTIGGAQAVSTTDNAYHAINDVINGASSIVVVDGSATTGLSPGANNISLASTFALGNNNNALTGSICEARFDNVAYNATQYGNLNTNQHSATNGYNF
jgi:hypothetical protein